MRLIGNWWRKGKLVNLDLLMWHVENNKLP